MKPRLPTSMQWTPFPPEFTEKVHQVLGENFREATQRGEFLVEGRIYPQEIVMRVGYIEHGRLHQDNLEASMDYSMKTEDQTAFKTIYACLDAIGSIFEEKFANPHEDFEFPLNWEAYEFDDQIVWMQYSTVNTRLEEEADRLLNSLDDKVLVQEDAPTEDALSRAVIDSELAEQVQKEIRKGPKIQ